jgi:hypothetical protein
MNKHRRPTTLAAPRGTPGLWWLLVAAALAFGGASLVRPAAAQAAAESKILSSDELADVVGPIALYPDDLIGIVLPASTYPLQIVEAARFLDKRKQDANLKPSQDWDDSVLALLNYPEVVHLLNDDLDWTWNLGTAVLNQRDDVLDAIQAFRERASDAGNLRTDNRQTVTKDSDGAIAIAPADPEVIYVPYYEPERVVVYQTAPVFFYYPWGYPVYYYPYPADYVFNTGFFWGVTSFFSIGWHSHLLYEHYYGHYDHPYYGHTYYRPFYVRNYFNGSVNVGRDDHVWQPRYRYGDRPIVRGREGRVVDSRSEPRVSHGVAGSASRSYRDAGTATRAPTTGAPRTGRGVGAVAGNGNERRTSPTSRPPTSVSEGGRTNRQTTTPGGSSGGYRVGGGMSRAAEQNRLNYYRGTARQGNVTRESTAPATRSAPPTFRAPATRTPTPTYRGPQTRSAPQRMAPAARAPEVRSAPQRSAPISRAPQGSSASAPRSYRSGGGSSYRGSSGSHSGGRSHEGRSAGSR